jgi:hypothetical protein
MPQFQPLSGFPQPIAGCSLFVLFLITDGVAFGTGNDWRTTEKAQAEALRRCRATEATKAAERCRIVATYRRECVAIAMDPEVGTPGYGWAVGPDTTRAGQRALEACKVTAGPARAQFCEVSLTLCDTKDESE